MHQPRPYGLHAKGAEPTDDDLVFVEALARNLTNLKQLSGVPSLRLTRTLPDGGYVVAQDMGGVFRCLTFKEPQPEQAAAVTAAPLAVPMLFSGVVTKAVVLGGDGVSLRITQQTRRRLALLALNGGMPPEYLKLQRFVVEFNPLVAEFIPDNPGVWTYTQYGQQRPTWYSGAMAEVMQIVGGYGRQDFGSLPDDPVERAVMKLPSDVAQAISPLLDGVYLPGYTGLPSTDGQYQYDYKFNNTHAVGFDASGAPWLLRVRYNGVWAMPLPVVPASATQPFRDWVQEMGDDELLAILDRFGGMPTGEAFPPDGAVFESWRRAGVIVKVCDTSDFYSHTFYSTACGWSFNLDGNEGVNTCHGWDDKGIGYGLTYSARLYLAAAAERGWVRAQPPADALDAQQYNAYLANVLRYAGTPGAGTAALNYKLRAVPAAQIMARLNYMTDAAAAQAEARYWDALELAPMAAHFGSVARTSSGVLFHPLPKGHPEIKFPEPIFGACVSYDFLPVEPVPDRPKCDTIMYAYYAGNDLKVVKYLYDARTFDAKEQNNFSDCMIVGSWQSVKTSGGSTLQGNFSASDFDTCATQAPTVTTTDIVGKDQGYDLKPFFSYDAFFSMFGTMWRNRYFSTRTTVATTDGHRLENAVVVPYLCRNAVLYATRRSDDGGSASDSLELHSVQDPNTYRYFTYDSVFAWSGPGASGAEGNRVTVDQNKVNPYPKSGSPVWVLAWSNNPAPCSDFADQGNWVGGLPSDYTWLIHPDANTWVFNGGGGAPRINTYSTNTPVKAKISGALEFSILPQPGHVHSDVPDGLYFVPSPDEYGDMFYENAARNLFGSTEYASVSQRGADVRRYWGYSHLVDHTQPPSFIGVINE
jgi:hypothetical protein